VTKNIKKQALYALVALLTVDLWFHIIPRIDWSHPVTSLLILAFGVALSTFYWEGLKFFVKRIDEG
jgi:hypothetical protein